MGTYDAPYYGPGRGAGLRRLSPDSRGFDSRHRYGRLRRNRPRRHRGRHERADRCSPRDQDEPGRRIPGSLAFATPTTYTFGNSERNLLLAIGLVNFDFSLSKKTNFSGADTGRYAELRAEFFNACNTPQFASPNAVFGTPQFGGIQR